MSLKQAINIIHPFRIAACAAADACVFPFYFTTRAPKAAHHEQLDAQRCVIHRVAGSLLLM